MMQSIILALKSPTGTHTYNILTRLRESPASTKCSKHMRAVLNSFPVLWSIWNTPQYPPPTFSFSAGLHTVSSLPVAPSQVLITPSPPPWPLPETFLPIQVPGLLFVCLFLKVFALFPSMPHLFASPSSLLCLVYTRLLACPLSFQPLKAFQAANKRQVPTTTKGLSAAFE